MPAIYRKEQILTLLREKRDSAVERRANEHHPLVVRQLDWTIIECEYLIERGKLFNLRLMPRQYKTEQKAKGLTHPLRFARSEGVNYCEGYAFDVTGTQSFAGWCEDRGGLAFDIRASRRVICFGVVIPEEITNGLREDDPVPALAHLICRDKGLDLKSYWS
jgi:hypothetical protein